MIFYSLLAAFACGRFEPAREADAQQLLRVVDGLQAPLRTSYLEYEGEQIASSPELRQGLGIDDGVIERYSGIFKYKQRDKYINVTFRERSPYRGNPARTLRQETMLSDGHETQILDKADGAVGVATTRHVVSIDFERTGSCGRIWLVRSLRELLKYNKKRLYHEGAELVDGVSCERYAFALGSEPYSIDDPKALIIRYWVDMNRGGNVLKHEKTNRGMPLSRTSGIVLERFKDRDVSFWLPVRGIVENLEPLTGKVNNTENYRLLKDTVKINRGVDDVQFTIKYPVGTSVSDRIRGLAYEVGQDRRPPPETLAEAEARLKDSLKKAEESRSELVAFSWSRGGFINWAVWLPLAVCLISAVGAGFVYLRRAS